MNLCPTRSIQTSNLRLKIHLGTSVILMLGPMAAGIITGVLTNLPWAEGLLVGIGTTLVGGVALMGPQLTLVDGLVTTFHKQ